MQKTIAVIGAAGYVGQYVLRALEHSGHSVEAITRGNGKILLEDFHWVHAINSVTSIDTVKKFDVVINLAYPTGIRSFEFRKKNKELIGLISTLSHNNTKIIHISTLAVFGFDLSQPLTAAPLAMRMDFPYVESKLHMELGIQRLSNYGELNIVRLGNVWGPGSKNWTAPLVNSILYQQPVAVANFDGYSNITDVHNVADYVSFLIENKQPEKVNYHHLAEFSNEKWSFWITELSRMLNVSPVFRFETEVMPTTMKNKALSMVKKILPVKTAKSFLEQKYAGSIIRKILSSVPISFFNALDRTSNEDRGARIDVFNPIYKMVLTCSKQFSSVTDESWDPPVDRKESVERVKQWVISAGYPVM